MADNHPTVPQIPRSCWPECQVCADGRRVESVRFLKPKGWNDQDLLTVEMKCHGDAAIHRITATELRECITDESRAKVFIEALCKMSYFGKEPKEPEPAKSEVLSRDDAPWNF